MERSIKKFWNFGIIDFEFLRFTFASFEINWMANINTRLVVREYWRNYLFYLTILIINNK